MKLVRRAHGDFALMIAIGGLYLLGCHGDTQPQVPTTFAKAAGDNQTGTVGAKVATAPAVVIEDANGKVIPALSVTFTPVGGGGTITGGTATTDAHGVATLGSWTLGTLVGTNALNATAAATFPGSLLRFTATGLAGPAATLAKFSTDPVAPPAGSIVDSIVVDVTDQFGNPLAGETVVFAVATGGGTVSPTSAVTGPSGHAGARWTLGNGAFTANSATATRAGFASPTVTFTTTTSVASLKFAARTMVVDSSAAFAPAVVGFDGLGNPAPGAGVTLIVRSPSVATTSGSTVTGVRSGQTLLIATAADNANIADSAVLVIANVNAPVITASVPRFDLKTDTTLTVSFSVDMRSSGEKLGSATLQITWDPAILTYVGDADGSALASATVNAGSAASGSLTMAMASTTGFGGVVEIRRVTFKVSSVAGRTGQPLRVFVLDMAGATTLTDLQPKTVTATYAFRTR